MSLDPTDLPIRHHHIRAMLRSPAHYLAVRRDQAEEDPSYAMERGSGLHELLAGRRPVLPWEDGRPRRGKDYDAFVAANPEALILTAADFALAEAMRAAVMDDPVAGPLLRAEGANEETIVWSIPGRDLRGRTTPDRRITRPDGSIDVIEIKTTRNADPERFVWSGRRDYGYHTQAALHAIGAMAKYGTNLWPAPEIRVYIVAIESTAPHIVSTIRVSPDVLRAGAAEIREVLDQIAACRDADAWPGYTPEVWTWRPDEMEAENAEG